jgi:PGF-pre-PGF domain-containing protein
VRVRKNNNINNRPLIRKVFHSRLLLNFIIILLILELLLIPFSVAELQLPKGTDGDTKTSDSGNDLPAVGDLPSDSDSGTIDTGDSTTSSDTSSTDKTDTSQDTTSDSNVVDDKPTDTTSDSTINDDTSTVTSDSSQVVNDKTYDSSDSNLIIDDKSLFDDDSNYAPNERVVSTDEIVTKTENEIGDLSSGEEIEVTLEYTADINSVKLTPSTDLEEVKVTVIKLKDKPEEIIDPPKENKTIYKYLDIKLSTNDTFIDEEEISSLEFNFKVEKSWIADNEIDKDTVKLIRYHDGVWQNLSTTLTSENETCISYIAVSPGFSTFAVVGSKVVEKSESYGSDDLSIPWSIIIGLIMLLTIMLIFILFKARYIYLKDDSK